MKQKLTTILFFLCIISNAQNADTTYSLDFKIKAKKVLNVGYVLENKKLRAEFILNEQVVNKYSIEIINDTVSILSRFENGNWQILDSILHTSYFISDSNKLYIPSFEITDFNKDGFQDLTCWVETNMNGNYWIIIYLFNPKTNTLEKLRNTAEQDEWEIWDNPIYNPKDSTIKCICEASIYGLYFESKYKLINLKAVPIEKYEEDRTSGKYIINRYYKGIQGKWKIIKKEKQ